MFSSGTGLKSWATAVSNWCKNSWAMSTLTWSMSSKRRRPNVTHVPSEAVMYAERYMMRWTLSLYSYTTSSDPWESSLTTPFKQYVNQQADYIELWVQEGRRQWSASRCEAIPMDLTVEVYLKSSQSKFHQALPVTSGNRYRAIASLSPARDEL